MRRLQSESLLARGVAMRQSPSMRRGAYGDAAETITHNWDWGMQSMSLKCKA